MSGHRRRMEKMVSSLPITPSPLPPFSGLSNSARARNPFLLGAGGCCVKSPNNSTPLSIMPLPLRSSASQASSELAAVQPNLSLVPFPFRSKSTPPTVPVIAKPSPLTSIRMGLPPHVSQPRQVQVSNSKSPPCRKHLLIKATVHVGASTVQV